MEMRCVNRVLFVCVCGLLVIVFVNITQTPSSESGPVRAPTPISNDSMYGNVTTKIPLSLRSRLWNDTVFTPNPQFRVSDAQVVRTRDMYADGHEWIHPELCADKAGVVEGAGQGRGQGEGVALVVAVMTSPGARAQRDAVRRTWGALAKREDLVLLFLFGKPPNNYNTAKLVEEDELYNDLVMAKGADTNSSLKTVSLLEWLALYCRSNLFVLRTTDDVFLNIDKLMEFVSSYDPVQHSRTIWGNVMTGRAVERHDAQSPFFLTVVQFAGSTLPTFAAGGTYLFLAEYVDQLLVACRDAPYIARDDIFITGVLAEAVGIQRKQSPGFMISLNVSSLDPCSLLDGWSLAKLTPLQQFEAWKAVSNPSTFCSQNNAITTTTVRNQ